MKLKNLPLFVCISLTSCLVGQRTKDTIKELKKDDKWVNEIIKLDKEISSKSDSIKLLKINLSTLKDSIAKIANNPNDSSKEKVGLAIDVHMSWFMEEGIYHTEYLVFPEFLTKSLKERCSMELIESISFKEIFENNREFLKIGSKQANSEKEKN